MQINPVLNVSFKGCQCCGGGEPVSFNTDDLDPSGTWDNIINASIQHLKRGDVLVCGINDNAIREEFPLNKHKIDTNISDIYTLSGLMIDYTFALYKDEKDNIVLVDCCPTFMQDMEKGSLEVSGKSVKNKAILKEGDNVITVDAVGEPGEIFTFSSDVINSNAVFEKYVKKSNDLKQSSPNEKMKMFYPEAFLLNKSPFQVKNQISFKDIGGQNENIEELETNVIFPFKYPEFFEGVRLNKGILLYGPPRCGKTMLANALANEMGVNFIKLSSDDLTEALVGKTEENWRNIFKSAIDNQPSLIFIDEFDGIARKRDNEDRTRGNNTVNQLLTLLSDLEKSDAQIFVIAATNRKDIIDPSFLATGRFGLQLEVKEPDIEGIKQIYDINAKSKFLDPGIDKDKLAEKMYNAKFNGSDVVEMFTIGRICALKRTGLYSLMKENKIKSTDIFKFTIKEKDLEEAIEKIRRQKES